MSLLSTDWWIFLDQDTHKASPFDNTARDENRSMSVTEDLILAIAKLRDLNLTGDFTNCKKCDKRLLEIDAFPDGLCSTCHTKTGTS